MAELPYSSTSAGSGREKEIRTMLREAGATAVGFMQDDDKRLVVCQFRLHGREITVPMSVAAYEAAWLRANECGPRTSQAVHKARAARQAELAVWGMLHDWIKAQTAMMICGFLDTDTAFLPHIHAADGRRIAEVIAAPGGISLLPKPEKRGETD